MRDEWADRQRYRLVFGTGSAHGIELMSDIACRHEHELFEAAHDGSFEIVWEDKRRAERLSTLADRISWARPGEPWDHAGRDQPGSSAVDVRVHTRTDYNEAIRQLVKEGAIDRGSAKGIKPDEPLRFVVRPLQSLLKG